MTNISKALGMSQLTLTALEESKSHQWCQEDLRLPDKISTGTPGSDLFDWWN